MIIGQEVLNKDLVLAFAAIWCQ